MHPGDQPGAPIVGVRLAAQCPYGVGCRQHRLEHDPNGDFGSAIQPCRDLPGVLRYLLQSLRAVEVLASGDEPDNVVFQGGHDNNSFAVMGMFL